MKTSTPLLWAHVCALAFLSTIVNAQDFIGQLQQPLLTDSIGPIGWHGESEDMSGGYAIGDTVADFQIYDREGNAIRLAELLAGEKPVVLSSASASCIRFSNAFNNDVINEIVLEQRDYMYNHRDDIEWLFIYGIEAHPGDLENCTSNCTAITIPAANGDTIFQHVQYSDRLAAIELWQSIDAVDTLNFDFGFPMAADNPNNAVYNSFFERPFGCLVVDCDGIVIERGDWTGNWLTDGGIQFLDSLLESPQVCENIPFCWEGSIDSDGDGICDGVELYQETDMNDPCDPDNTDTDEDGVCDIQEIIDGTDPFVSDVVTAVENMGTDKIRAYPNPCAEQLTISLGAQHAQVVLRDLQGKVVVHEMIQQQAKLNLLDLESGMYILDIHVTNGARQIMKITKE